MSHVRHPGAALSIVGMLLIGCQGPDAGFAPVTGPSSPDAPAADHAPAAPSNYRISDSIELSQKSLTPLADGVERPIGASLSPDGDREEFVINEVILRPESPADLDDFLTRYNGVVLRDGTLEPPPDVEAIESFEPTGYYLVRIDPQASDMNDLDENLRAAGVEGQVQFSSEDTVRLAALLLRERTARRVAPNLVLTPNGVLEHAENQFLHFNAEDWRWMSESSNGYSVGVIHAWEYMKYHNIPAAPVAGETVFQDLQRVAVIDRGFALDEITGRPLNDNPDYFYFGNNGPIQYHITKGINRAGGEGFNWHGSKSFGVCCARQSNQYGTAGTGAPVTEPVLIRGEGLMGVTDAIRAAAIWYRADVISISSSIDCGLWCDLHDGGDIYQNAVNTATTFGSVVVVNAANDGIDISDRDVYPCKLDGVICVGSVYQGGPNGDITLRYNYGDGVDIWAPTCVYTTVTPDRADDDANDFGEDEIKEYCGTSASTPFVAGIVALMRAMDASLDAEELLRILQETSNEADDPRVTHGYVDAYRAVKAIRPNQPPVVELLSPVDGGTVSYDRMYLAARVIDPEPGAQVEDLDVLFSSENGTFANCIGSIRYESDGPIFECVTEVDTGLDQVVRVTAFDPHQGRTVVRATIDVVNTPPNINIVEPADGATVFDHRPVELAAYIQDPEEHPFPDDQVSWQSDVDGDLGVGWSVTPKLSQGSHVITATATDETGTASSDSVTLNVISGLGVPTGMITQPDVASGDPNFGSLVVPGDPVKLAAIGSDPEDGALGDAAFEWYSDRDGFLGTGQSINVLLSGPATPCNPEFRVHHITLVITDSDGNSITLDAVVSVGVVC